jgi:lactam utilization protein B
MIRRGEEFGTRTMRIDLNSNLGESFVPWRMGDDAAEIA